MQVTFVEAMPNIMPGFDREIAKLAQRLLINGRNIEYYTNVIASKVTPGAHPAAWPPGCGGHLMPGVAAAEARCHSCCHGRQACCPLCLGGAC